MASSPVARGALRIRFFSVLTGGANFRTPVIPEVTTLGTSPHASAFKFGLTHAEQKVRVSWGFWPKLQLYGS